MGRQTCHYPLDPEEEELDGDLAPFRPERSFGRLNGSRIKNQGGCSEATGAGDESDVDDVENAYCCAAQSDYLRLLQDPSDSRDSLADPGG
jgi:hypothetical protein